MSINTTPGTQQYSGAQQLQITRKSSLTDAAQSALRQVERWANNLFPSNPTQGQVLTATANHEGRQVLSWATPSSGGSGGILAVNDYNNPTGGTGSGYYEITTATDTVVDATHMAVTFTAPTSGSVLVECNGTAGTTLSSVSNVEMWWHIIMLGGAGTVVTPGKLAASNANTPQLIYHASPSFLVQGLTAGTSYTAQWSAYVVTGHGYIYCGEGGQDSATMIVSAIG